MFGLSGTSMRIIVALSVCAVLVQILTSALNNRDKDPDPVPSKKTGPSPPERRKGKGGLILVDENIAVCGQSGQNNCVEFSACSLIQQQDGCQNVKDSHPIPLGDGSFHGLGGGGSKGKWPLSYHAYCQVSGFTRVPEGVKITTFRDDNTDCEEGKETLQPIYEGGNCCEGWFTGSHCLNSTEPLDTMRCAHPQYPDGSFGGPNFVCSFKADLLDGYTCEAAA